VLEVLWALNSWPGNSESRCGETALTDDRRSGFIVLVAAHTFGESQNGAYGNHPTY